jgi:hypothetical protein
MKWPEWDTVLGSLMAEFGHEPNGKVEAYMILYNIYLVTMAHRATG